MFSRFVSPTLFGLVVLCFFLPFATVSCDSATTTFTGIQLVTHTVPSGGVLHEEPDCSTDIGTCVERTSSTTAGIALAAVIVGLVLGLLGVVRGPGWSALVALGALAVLPFEGPFFGPDVKLHAGYALTLLLVAVVGCVHVSRAWRRRREESSRIVARHGAALFAYLVAVLVALVPAAGSSGFWHDVGAVAVSWLMLTVVPSWLVVGVLLVRWRRQGRPDLQRRADRWDGLLWLGPFLWLGLASRRLRSYLVPALAQGLVAA